MSIFQYREGCHWCKDVVVHFRWLPRPGHWCINFLHLKLNRITSLQYKKLKAFLAEKGTVKR